VNISFGDIPATFISLITEKALEFGEGKASKKNRFSFFK
jgi:hypothetical protein